MQTAMRKVISKKGFHKVRRALLGALAAIFLTSCAIGPWTAGLPSAEPEPPLYTAPASRDDAPDFVIVNAPFESVWSQTIPEFEKTFYVINNMDKASGVINVGFSEDPERAVDCGQLRSQAFLHEADFAAADANQTYYAAPKGILPWRGLFPIKINRKVSIDGRANVVFEELSPTSTRVTVTAHYVVIRDDVIHGPKGPIASHGSIAFATGSSGKFADGCVCKPNGRLEGMILGLVK